MSVGMAFDHFARQQVEIAIIEVGMGGRLDSTNIINPELSVITNIGLDHTAFLGEDLATIAGEKAGIIKEQVPVVVGEKQQETQPVFQKKATEMQARIFFAEDYQFPVVESDLKGAYQKKNLRTVMTVIKVLAERGWKLSEAEVKNGLSKVKLLTGLQGRWDVLQLKPKVICDTAHNAEGLKIVLKQLKKEKFQHLHILIGVVNDKDLSKVLDLFPKEATYYFAKPNVPRGLEAQLLQQEAVKYGLEGKVFDSVKDAYDTALDAALDDDLIFIGGSNFTVAEVL